MKSQAGAAGHVRKRLVRAAARIICRPLWETGDLTPCPWTVICGPGDIEQAHRPNEFVSLAQLAQCEAFMQRLLENEV
jgi:acetylornithine deacetylase/succinyl-diaminopimelate desuccinylase-like protein